MIFFVFMIKGGHLKEDSKEQEYICKVFWIVDLEFGKGVRCMFCALYLFGNV